MKPLVYDTYLEVIKNSVGSNLFRTAYVEQDGKKVDVMNNGELSCAFFVSSVLTLCEYLPKVRATVDSTVKDLLTQGWEMVSEAKLGAILVWDGIDFGDGALHKHIGFYIGNNKAISNSWTVGSPIEHDWTLDGKRKVDRILWSAKL